MKIALTMNGFQLFLIGSGIFVMHRLIRRERRKEKPGAKVEETKKNPVSAEMKDGKITITLDDWRK